MPYDSLDSWRKEVGIKTSKGETIRYEGGCEDDPTADAIRAYMREQELAKKAAAEKAKNDGEGR